MKLKALVITALFVTGVAASVAVAKGPPPGKGKDKGKTPVAATTGSTTTASKKIWICHRTGSASNPYRKIRINTKAWPAHQGHGDIALSPVPGSHDHGTTGTTGETSTSVSTGTGTTGTTTGGKGKGKNKKSSSGCPSSVGGGTTTGSTTTSTTPTP